MKRNKKPATEYHCIALEMCDTVFMTYTVEEKYFKTTKAVENFRNKHEAEGREVVIKEDSFDVTLHLRIRTVID